jgi:hypothetical protein
MVKVSKKTSILESLELSKKEQKRLGIELGDSDYKGDYHHQNYSILSDKKDYYGQNVIIVTMDIKSEKITIQFIMDIDYYIYDVVLSSKTNKDIFNQILEDGIKLLQSLEKK